MKSETGNTNKKMFIYWYIKTFHLKEEIAERFDKDPKKVMLNLFRTKTESAFSQKVAHYLVEKYKISPDITHDQITQKEFLNYISL